MPRKAAEAFDGGSTRSPAEQAYRADYNILKDVPNKPSPPPEAAKALRYACLRVAYAAWHRGGKRIFTWEDLAKWVSTRRDGRPAAARLEFVSFTRAIEDVVGSRIMSKVYPAKGPAYDDPFPIQLFQALEYLLANATVEAGMTRAAKLLEGKECLGAQAAETAVGEADPKRSKADDDA